MGHSDKIHKDHYRQPLASRDILKISQYLEAVQSANNSDEDSTDSNFENDETLKENNFSNNINNNIVENKGISSNEIIISILIMHFQLTYFIFYIYMLCIILIYIIFIIIYIIFNKLFITTYIYYNYLCLCYVSLLIFILMSI